MLLFITTRGHGYTVECLLSNRGSIGRLLNGSFGRDIPKCRVTSYDALFASRRTICATHIFTDIERLYPWELKLAAELYRLIRAAGIPCLNDPARVMSRYELLRNLYSIGFNSFNVYRAEDQPRPERFPVFVRFEADHLAGPLSDLLHDQTALDDCLERLRSSGTPMRGLIVVEFANEEIAPGAWRRYGTFQIGTATHVDHAVVEDRWLVKFGKAGLSTNDMLHAEKAAVLSNALADQIRPAFATAGIEWGRADHAAFRGRQVVYEINTNPFITGFRKLLKTSPAIRHDTVRFARQRMAEQLWQIDHGDGSSVPFRKMDRFDKYLRRKLRLGRPLPRP
jgi:hypothetical protein